MKWQDGDYPTADQMRMETQCFKSAWLGVALHEGFAFPEDYDRLSAAPETVNGKVVHWTIGALLYRTRFLPLRYVSQPTCIIYLLSWKLRHMPEANDFVCTTMAAQLATHKSDQVQRFSGARSAD